MKKKRTLSEGPCVGVRNALVKKLRATGPYFNPRLKIIASVLETYPADAENVYTAAQWTAAALVHEAMKIMDVVGHLAPEKPGKTAVEATMETMPKVEDQEARHAD